MSAPRRNIRLLSKTTESLRSRLIAWGGNNFRRFPWRKTKNKFHALLAELLLQRTRAEQVVPVFSGFCRKFPSARKLATAPPNEVQALLFPLGLHWRASWLQQFAREIAASGGAPPTNLEQLDRLPGVGPYAAAAFLSFHCGRRAPIIDSNIVRLYGRILGFPTDNETRRKKWVFTLAEKLTPKYRFKEFNYALLDFTGAICKPRPLCSACPLLSICKHGRWTVRSLSQPKKILAR